MRGARSYLPRSLAALAVCTLVPLLGGCTLLQAVLFGDPMPTVNLRSVRLEQLRTDGVTLHLDVEVSNPYSVALPLVNAQYRFTAHGQQFITGETQIGGSIPAHGSKIISLPVDISFARLIATLAQVRPGMVIPYEAAVTLSVDTPVLGVIGIPIRKTGELPVPAMPKIALTRIEWKRFALGRAEAVLHLSMTNPNDFPFDLTQFTYDLKLGGVQVAVSRITQTAQFKEGEAKTIAVQVAFSPVKLGLAAINILQGRDAAYEIHGALVVDTAFGRIDLPYKASGRTRLSKARKP